MRKIIITIIVTILTVGNIQGQMSEWIAGDHITASNAWREKFSVDENLPNFQSFVGGSAKISANIWRFNPFIKLGQSIGLTSGGVEIRYIFETNHEGLPFNRPDNSWVRRNDMNLSTSNEARRRLTTLTMGTDFRFANNSYVRFSADLRNSLVANSIYAGLLRRQQIAQGTWIDIGLGYKQGRRTIVGPLLDIDRVEGFSVFSKSFDFRAVQAGLQLRQRVIENLYVTAGVSFKNKFETNDEMGDVVESLRPQGIPDRLPLPEVSVVKNALKFSIGIHKNFPIRVQNQPRQIQPRQRVAPHQRALPCPPGQMRHVRSWDRPSSVFNHPSGR